MPEYKGEPSRGKVALPAIAPPSRNTMPSLLATISEAFRDAFAAGVEILELNDLAWSRWSSLKWRLGAPCIELREENVRVVRKRIQRAGPEKGRGRY